MHLNIRILVIGFLKPFEFMKMQQKIQIFLKIYKKKHKTTFLNKVQQIQILYF